MTFVLIRIALISAALAIAGCGDGGRSRPPSTRVTVINVAPSYPALNFGRGLTGPFSTDATLDFRQLDNFTFDEDQYTFRIRLTPLGANEPEEIASFTETVSSGTDYLIVLAESNDEIEPLIFSWPSFPSDSADSQFSVVHAAGTLPNIDFYLLPVGTDIGTAVPVGALTFLGGLAPMNTSAGEYIIALTEQGNAANVLFTSPQISIAAGQTVSFVLADGANAGLAEFVVILVSNASRQLIDDNIDSGGLRAINGVADRLPRDLYLEQEDAPLTMPVIGAAPFGMSTAPVDVAVGDLELTVTPAANPSVAEIESVTALGRAILHTALVGGDPGSILMSIATEELRPIRDQSRIRVYNLFNRSSLLEILLLAPGTDPATRFATEVLSATSAGTRIPFPPGDYELTLRDIGGNIVLGPELLSFANRGVYSIFIFDNADGTTADIVVVDELN